MIYNMHSRRYYAGNSHKNCTITPQTSHEVIQQCYMKKLTAKWAPSLILFSISRIIEGYITAAPAILCRCRPRREILWLYIAVMQLRLSFIASTVCNIMTKERSNENVTLFIVIFIVFTLRGRLPVRSWYVRLAGFKCSLVLFDVVGNRAHKMMSNCWMNLVPEWFFVLIAADGVRVAVFRLCRHMQPTFIIKLMVTFIPQII